MVSFDTNFNASVTIFKTDFSESVQSFNASYGQYIEKTIISSAYTGDYEIVPSTEDQMIDCNGKYMSDDLVCKAIPYYEVSNTDGLTVYIGKENINGN